MTSSSPVLSQTKQLLDSSKSLLSHNNHVTNDEKKHEISHDELEHISSRLTGRLSLQFDDDAHDTNLNEDANHLPPPSSSLLLPSPSMTVSSTLTLSSQSILKPHFELSSANWQDDTIDSPTPRKCQYRVMFEIISAKTITSRPTSGRKMYVSYTILIKRVPGLENHPGVVERRFTDFFNLYQALKKRYPSLLTDFPFPKKTLTGNFTPAVISERSVAFQHLLAYCLSIRELRITREFSEFLCGRELKEAHRLMRSANFEESANILENAYFIQEKLALHNGETNVQLFNTLCMLIASLNALNNTEDAQKYAEKAIQLISSSNVFNHNELVVPLMILSSRLWRACGKDKHELDDKLENYKRINKINIDGQPTLLEIVLRKDFY